MLKNKVEDFKVKNWNYQRFGFHSQILNQFFHCGFFRPCSKNKIDHTFYLFHGGDGDDYQPVQVGLLPLLADLLDQNPQNNIQFVFPYIGKSFLRDHPLDPTRAFTSYFWKELLPFCEASTNTEAKTRYLGGWSMGGRAALSLFMRFSHQFNGVGVHFPTLVKFNYQDPQECRAYGVRQHVRPLELTILVQGFQSEFIDERDFAAHDPLALAKTKAPSLWQEKKIYFDVGQDDEFGLSEGVRELHLILRQHQVPHCFEEVPSGKHDGPFVHAQLPKMLSFIL